MKNNDMKLFVFPGNIEDEILSIATEQIPYFRTDWFSNILLENECMLLDLIGCSEGRVIPYTASGTAAMEACLLGVSQIVDKKILTIAGGTFGCRWGEMCRMHDIDYCEFPVEYGKDINMQGLRDEIVSGAYGALMMPHNETLSGTLYDIETISKWCKESGTLYLVDAISSFLADEFLMDLYGVDIAITSSQKGLTLPPGMSFVVLSKDVVSNAAEVINGFYYDWKKHLSESNLPRGQTPFSPATHLVMQMHKRLKGIVESGIESFQGHVQARASAFREEIKKYGWEFTTEGCMASCVTGIRLPVRARPLVDYLESKNIYVIPSYDKPPFDHVLRVAHYGCLTPNDDVELAKEMKKWIKNQK